MKNLIKLIKQSSYMFVNKKLYIKDNNNKFIRIKQKLPEFIEDIDELKEYDIKYK